MGGKTPKNENMESPVSHILSWITSKAESMNRHHLEGFGTASIIILTCFYFYWKRYGRKNVRNYHRSQSLGALHGGKVAMQRILDAQHARIDPSVLDGAAAQLKDLLPKEHLNFSQLQSVVAKLEMSGKEQTAVEMLSKALEKANNKGHYHEAYELDMLIVEMLIYKGDYERALNRKCLQDQEISDARRPLYKTVIRIMQDQKRVAREYWNEFKAIRSNFQWPDYFDDELVDEVKYDFDMFVNTVLLLKKEIDHVHKNDK